jgi:hypothetical protein
MDYKVKIYAAGIDRRMIADRLKLSYNQLNARLGGFTPWQGSEERQLQTLLAELDQKKEAEKCL